MRHIRPESLDEIEPLLEDVRRLAAKCDGMREKKRGVWYRRSKAFLHFHEDPSGIFADVRVSGLDFDRIAVSSKSGRQALLKAILSAFES